MNLSRDLEVRAFGSEPVACSPPKEPVKYEALAEPCGGYAVFDICRGHPADIEGQVLIGLEKRDAVFVTNLLNDGGCLCEIDQQFSFERREVVSYSDQQRMPLHSREPAACLHTFRPGR
jgi:hypothetical protein